MFLTTGMTIVFFKIYPCSYLVWFIRFKKYNKGKCSAQSLSWYESVSLRCCQYSYSRVYLKEMWLTILEHFLKNNRGSKFFFQKMRLQRLQHHRSQLWLKQGEDEMSLLPVSLPAQAVHHREGHQLHAEADAPPQKTWLKNPRLKADFSSRKRKSYTKVWKASTMQIKGSELQTTEGFATFRMLFSITSQLLLSSCPLLLSP